MEKSNSQTALDQGHVVGRYALIAPDLVEKFDRGEIWDRVRDGSPDAH